MASQKLRILTWHIHGSYLYYLVQGPHEFYLPYKAGRPDGYAGRTESYAWPENVHEIPAEEIRNLDLDCVVFQSKKNYLEDQYEILSPEQQELPRIYLEHDPPREHPTDTRHPVDDPNILLVHVTNFNDLMWDSGRTRTRVIDHGVIVPETARYTGELERGLVVVNNLRLRGRRLGLDIFEEVRREIPLDVVGINAGEVGGMESLPHRQLLELEGRYRFIFNPIRYTSLGLAICEAMMIGMPIIGLATTEMVTAVENGISGYVDTDIKRLLEHMHRLLSSPVEAHRLGEGARLRALQRFNIQRFVFDWNEAFAAVIGVAAPGLAGLPQETLYE
jgi:glycosyltransferase involved in cell wall biosynthesis